MRTLIRLPSCASQIREVQAEVIKEAGPDGRRRPRIVKRTQTQPAATQTQPASPGFDWHGLAAKGGRGWAPLGMLAGGALGALMPGKDDDGESRGALSGALRGAVAGGLVGGLGGAAAKRIWKPQAAPAVPPAVATQGKAENLTQNTEAGRALHGAKMDNLGAGFSQALEKGVQHAGQAEVIKNLGQTSGVLAPRRFISRALHAVGAPESALLVAGSRRTAPGTATPAALHAVENVKTLQAQDAAKRGKPAPIIPPVTPTGATLGTSGLPTAERPAVEPAKAPEQAEAPNAPPLPPLPGDLPNAAAPGNQLLASSLGRPAAPVHQPAETAPSPAPSPRRPGAIAAALYAKRKGVQPRQSTLSAPAVQDALRESVKKWAPVSSVPSPHAMVSTNPAVQAALAPLAAPWEAASPPVASPPVVSRAHVREEARAPQNIVPVFEKGASLILSPVSVFSPTLKLAAPKRRPFAAPKQTVAERVQGAFAPRKAKEDHAPVAAAAAEPPKAADPVKPKDAPEAPADDKKTASAPPVVVPAAPAQAPAVEPAKEAAAADTPPVAASLIKPIKLAALAA